MGYFWTKGLELEADVITWLQLQGYSVITSTRVENVKQDIDCWVRGYRFNTWVSVSIKSQAAGISTGHIGLEDTNERCPNGRGWYQTGKAQYYLILRDRTALTEEQTQRYQVPEDYQPRLYWVSKIRCQAMIATGFYSYKGLSRSTYEQQGCRGSNSYYLDVKRLLRNADVELLPVNWRDIVEVVKGKK